MSRGRVPKTKDVDFEEKSDQDPVDEEESEQLASETSEAESDQQLPCDEEGDEVGSRCDGVGDSSQEAKPKRKKSKKEKTYTRSKYKTRGACILCGDLLNGERYNHEAAHRRCVLGYRSFLRKLKGQRKLALKLLKKS